MGQAMVDLPDPLETPPVMGAAGADDLLAQMAGDEIDRLLAEAEADAPKVDPLPLVSPAAEPKAVPLVALTASAAAEPQNFSDQSPKTVAQPTAESDLAGELDSLLDSLTTASPVRPSPEAAPVSPVVSAIDADEAAAVPTIESPVVTSGETAALLSATAEAVAATGEFSPPGTDGTSAAERAALTAGAAPTEAIAGAAPSIPADAAPDSQADRDAPLPLLLRPLEWINAPMNACPDLLREFIGKAAILTFVNAGAIIFYVRFIRRH